MKLVSHKNTFVAIGFLHNSSLIPQIILRNTDEDLFVYVYQNQNCSQCVFVCVCAYVSSFSNLPVFLGNKIVWLLFFIFIYQRVVNIHKMQTGLPCLLPQSEKARYSIHYPRIEYQYLFHFTLYLISFSICRNQQSWRHDTSPVCLHQRWTVYFVIYCTPKNVCIKLKK